MEEKKYPVFEEEFEEVACEPVTNTSAALSCEYEDPFDDVWIDDLDWNRQGTWPKAESQRCV